MKKLLPLLLILNSCALFMPNKEPEDRVYEYLTGEEMEMLDSESVKNYLGKEASMAGGDYQLFLFPVSLPYLKAKLNELKQQRGLNKKEEAATLNEWQNSFTKDKSCIKMQYQVKLKEEVGQLKNWQLELIDKKGDTYPLQFRQRDLDQRTVISNKQTYHGKVPLFLGEGVACSEAAVDLTKGFTVAVKAKFVQWPFPQKIKVEWNFNHFVNRDGKKVFVKKVKKTQKYRGW